MEALLEYRQTDVCYGGVRAVRGVSFTLHAGEILGVVGESGCGKSTLLRAAMGLLGPGGLVTGGKILYRGENLPDLSRRARRRLNGPELGMIFQSAGSSFCPVRRALLDRLGLEDGPRILNSYPFELSGGMQQRVGIAAAMLLRPRVLLADEPTAALDVSAQKQVQEELLLVRESFGTAMVLVSHNLGLVAAMADRVLVMRRGEIVEAGETRQVLRQPRADYTRRLLEAVPKLRRA